MITTLKDMLDYGTDTLQKAGKADSRSDAWYLLSYCMKMSRAEFYMKQNTEMDEKDIASYKKLIDIRTAGMPLQYITGSQEFMGIDFYVDESVLVPRQDTETLVECVLEHIKESFDDKLKILDMCTGSGCIAISVAKFTEEMSVDVDVTASDISKEALLVAKKNAARNDVDVEFIQSDIWENISPGYDIIISNPPYIRTEDVATLMPEVRLHEPTMALDGGSDGLVFYKRIIEGLAENLNDNGMVFFEIGYDQADDVSDLLHKEGFHGINVVKDLAGLDRVVYGKK